MNPDQGIKVQPSTTWLVYARQEPANTVGAGKNGLSYVGQGYGSAESVFISVARRENLPPGKYLALSLDLTQVATATITHRVVMDPFVEGYDA